MTRMRWGLIVGGSALLFTVAGPFLYSASGLDNPVANCSPVGSLSPVRHHHHHGPVGSSSPVGDCSSIGNLAPTAVTVAVSGGGQYGRFVTVSPDDLVNAQATLSGPDAATAGGTVTYKVFSLRPDHWAWNQVAPSDTVSVTDGTVPGSAQVTLGPGVYTWTATYSGDSVNAPAQSSVHADIEAVLPASCPMGVGWLSMRCFGDNAPGVPNGNAGLGGGHQGQGGSGAGDTSSGGNGNESGGSGSGGGNNGDSYRGASGHSPDNGHGGNSGYGQGDSGRGGGSWGGGGGQGQGH